MEQRMSRWGVGPRTFVPSTICGLAAWAAGSRWPGIFLLRPLPDAIGACGVVLTVAGLALWITGAVTVMRAYNRDQLVTSGVFGLVRHPVYGAWIVLIFPGLALMAGSWLMLITPLFAYAIFRRLIPREDAYLTKRFGQPYVEYRRRVNELIPMPRFPQR